MGHSVKLADLRSLMPKDRDVLLEQFVAESVAPTNGQLNAVHARVRAFEAKYEMKSDDLVRCLEHQQMRETADIAQWLFCLGVIAKHGGQKARAEQA